MAYYKTSDATEKYIDCLLEDIGFGVEEVKYRTKNKKLSRMFTEGELRSD